MAQIRDKLTIWFHRHFIKEIQKGFVDKIFNPLTNIEILEFM